MNCARVRKFLPLLAGDDLTYRKARRLEKHLEGCPGCNKESEEIRAALAGIRAVAGREALDWAEGEWKGLMARVRSEKPEPRPALPLCAVPKKAWAYGFIIILILGLAALVLRTVLLPPASPFLSETIAATTAGPSRVLIKDRVPFGAFPQDGPFRVQKAAGVPDRAVLAARPSPEKATQDLMSLTLVSQETGLKVHWTFNRNFEWEEKKR